MNTILQLLTDQGATGGLAEGIRLLVNEAMRQERSQALQAQPYQRTQTRQGHANGFKPKTLGTRLGPIQFQVPQVRGGLEFYPSALEKGVRSEQALKLALAEMYVQGVSTRKVSAIVEQFCGTTVSSSKACSSAGCTASSSSSAMTTPAWARPAPPSFPPCRGNAASSTSSKMPKAMSPAWTSGLPSPRPSAVSSTAPAPDPPGGHTRRLKLGRRRLLGCLA